MSFPLGVLISATLLGNTFGQSSLTDVDYETLKDADEPGSGYWVSNTNTIWSPEANVFRYSLALNLPDNPDVLDNIPQETKEIHLWNCSGNWNSESIVKTAYPALKNHPNISRVHLCGFNTGINDTRFPLNSFLQNVRPQLKHLAVDRTKLLYLDAGDLQSFSALVTLSFFKCGIAAVAPDSLLGMVALEVPYLYQQRTLTDFHFERNPLGVFDWNVFAPFKDSLQRVYIRRNALHTIKVDAGLVMPQLAHVDLSRNRFTIFPQHFWKVLNQTNLGTFTIEGNNFCPCSTPTLSCSDCCEFQQIPKEGVSYGNVACGPRTPYQTMVTRNWHIESSPACRGTDSVSGMELHPLMRPPKATTCRSKNQLTTPQCNATSNSFTVSLCQGLANLTTGTVTIVNFSVGKGQSGRMNCNITYPVPPHSMYQHPGMHEPKSVPDLSLRLECRVPLKSPTASLQLQLLTSQTGARKYCKAIADKLVERFRTKNCVTEGPTDEGNVIGGYAARMVAQKS